jgi:hypothetical protein
MKRTPAFEAVAKRLSVTGFETTTEVVPSAAVKTFSTMVEGRTVRASLVNSTRVAAGTGVAVGFDSLIVAIEQYFKRLANGAEDR